MIRAQGLSKYYGSKRALGPISFEIEDGETVGFLGLNGAGKTTALRIFACDLRPSSGSVSVGDIDALRNPHEVRKRIGYLPENPPLYQEMLVGEYLHYAGRLRQMSKSEVEARLPEVLELTDLKEVQDEIISTLSHGFRQRVGVGQAIMHQPQLLILDEPTRGLDPVQIVEMRNMIRNLKDNHTVLVSSHILTEISETCDRLLVLGQGEVLASGSEGDLAKQMRAGSEFLITIALKEGTSVAQLHKSLQSISDDDDLEVSIVKEHAKQATLSVRSSKDLRASCSRVIVQEGHGLLELTRNQQELENIFLRLVSGDQEKPSSKTSTKSEAPAGESQ